MATKYKICSFGHINYSYKLRKKKYSCKLSTIVFVKQTQRILNNAFLIYHLAKIEIMTTFFVEEKFIQKKFTNMKMYFKDAYMFRKYFLNFCWC
jgi:hypothetical protein